MCTRIFFRKNARLYLFTFNKKFFEASALGMPDNESQKGVKI